MCKRGGPHSRIFGVRSLRPYALRGAPARIGPLILPGSRAGPQQGSQGQCETACRPSALPAGPVAPIGGGVEARPGAASPACHSGGVGPGGRRPGPGPPGGAPALSQGGYGWPNRGCGRAYSPGPSAPPRMLTASARGSRRCWLPLATRGCMPGRHKCSRSRPSRQAGALRRRRRGRCAGRRTPSQPLHTRHQPRRRRRWPLGRSPAIPQPGPRHARRWGVRWVPRRTWSRPIMATLARERLDAAGSSPPRRSLSAVGF